MLTGLFLATTGLISIGVAMKGAALAQEVAGNMPTKCILDD